MKSLFLLLACLFCLNAYSAEKDANKLFIDVRNRLNEVKDYTADVKMRIDVSFMRIPTLYGKLYFKSPDKMKLERNGGISILPRKSISLTLNNLVPAGDATIIDAGTEVLSGKKLRILKVVPGNDAADIILTKLWVDEERLLVQRVETTTRDNGTVSMNLEFGKYAAQALPDRITFFIDVKDFKMPKGVTMDYDAGETETVKKESKGKPKKGTIRIDYLSYKINTGLSDAVFAEEKKR
jgi:outer membrane lipoprotein-sorting protein